MKKVYETKTGKWIMCHLFDPTLPDWKEINPDPTIAHRIQLESCTAVVTRDSVYFRDAAAPVLTLEEMQRVVRCMEMLKDAGE